MATAYYASIKGSIIKVRVISTVRRRKYGTLALVERTGGTQNENSKPFWVKFYRIFPSWSEAKDFLRSQQKVEVN